jgi:FixJ family two-component response regulator
MVDSASLLLVEDDRLVASALGRGLRSLGYGVDTARGLRSARAKLECGRYGGIVVDLALPDGCGSALLAAVSRVRPRPTAIVISGCLTAELGVAVAGLCDAVLPKPLTHVQVAKALGRARRPTHDAVAAYAHSQALSPKEGDALREAIAGGTSNDQARRLACEVTTLNTHWRRIFQKTGIRSKAEVIAAVLIQVTSQREPP